MKDQAFIDELSGMVKALRPEIKGYADLYYQMNATTHTFISTLYNKSGRGVKCMDSWLGIPFHINDNMADGTVILAPIVYTTSKLVFLEKVYPWRDLQLPKGESSSSPQRGHSDFSGDIYDIDVCSTTAPSAGQGDLFFEALRREWHQLDRIWDRLDTPAKKNFLEKWSDHSLMDAKERCLVDERYEDASLIGSIIEERLFCI